MRKILEMILTLLLGNEGRSIVSCYLSLYSTQLSEGKDVWILVNLKKGKNKPWQI